MQPCNLRLPHFTASVKESGSQRESPACTHLEGQGKTRDTCWHGNCWFTDCCHGDTGDCHSGVFCHPDIFFHPGIFGTAGELQTMTCVAFSPGSNTYSGSMTGEIYVWNGNHLAEVLPAHKVFLSDCVKRVIIPIVTHSQASLRRVHNTTKALTHDCGVTYLTLFCRDPYSPSQNQMKVTFLVERMEQSISGTFSSPPSLQ